MGRIIERAMPGVAVTLLLSIALWTDACGEAGSSVTLTIPARGGDAEQELLGQIYAQGLRGAGYAVRTTSIPSETRLAMKALQQGRLAGYADHLNTTMEWLASVRHQPKTGGPSSSRVAYEIVKRELGENGLTAFPPTPFGLSNYVVLLKTTARKRNLQTVSGLTRLAHKLTIGGVPGCHEAVNCVAGLERYYGPAFSSFDIAIKNEAQLFHALESGRDAAVMVPTTNGRLLTERKRFAELREDRHVFPAGNAIFVTTPEMVEKAGSGYEEAITGVQKGLTQEEMQKLDAQVEVDGKSPAAVAAKYLESIGYGG